MNYVRNIWTNVQLRWKNFDFLKFVKNGDNILKFMGRVFVLFLVVWILWAFRKVYVNESYTIEPFSVPPSLVERGYSGDVVVEKVLSEVQHILSKRYYDERNPEAYRKIASQPTLHFASGSRAGYFDLQSLFQVGKLLLGKKDNTIKGHITRDGEALQLNLHLPDAVAQPFLIQNPAHLDSLFLQAAVYLIKQTTPQYLVYYFLDKGQFTAAEQLLQTIDFNLNNQKNAKNYRHERLQWFLSMTNLEMARQNWDAARTQIREMQTVFPDDLATYTQWLNILTQQVISLENQQAPPSTFTPIAQEAIEIANKIDKNNWNSIFLDKQKALGWINANWAYMLQKTNANDANILAKYEKGISLLPNSATPYNNLSYFYMDKKNYAAAEDALKKALIADYNNGNTWDTYAELMLMKGDTNRFFYCLDKALQFQNPTEGIGVAAYQTDRRWQTTRQMTRFGDLILKYSSKNDYVLKKR